MAAPFFAADERRRLERLRVAAPFRAELLRPLRLRPPLLRDDPDRELFRRRELLDFLAAAIKKLRVGGFVERIARFAHNNAAQHRLTAQQILNRTIHHVIVRVSPCRITHKSSSGRPAFRQLSRMRAGGSSIGSSVSLNVPQCAPTNTSRSALPPGRR